MSDSEKIMKGLERCSGDNCKPTKCPYAKEEFCTSKLHQDVKELIDEMQTKINNLLIMIDLNREIYEIAIANLKEEISMMKLIYVDQGKVVGELVRCKYCRKRNTYNCWMFFVGRMTGDDFFCADGKRREEL